MLFFEVFDICSLTWSNQTVLEIIWLQKQHLLELVVI